MEEIEPKSTIGAIAILLVGRESSTELAGSTLALIPYNMELGLEVFDSTLPSSTIGPVELGLGLLWECLEQAPASKEKGLGNSGPEQLLSIPKQGAWASENPLSIP